MGDEWTHDENGYAKAFEIAVIVEEEDDYGGRGIPGFPVAAIVLGLALAFLIQLYTRRDPSFSLTK